MAETNRDRYKSDIIRNNMWKMDEDPYYLVRLKGDDNRAINLDENALRLLKAYYDGKITKEQIDALCTES